MNEGGRFSTEERLRVQQVRIGARQGGKHPVPKGKYFDCLILHYYFFEYQYGTVRRLSF
jgi:hypothetical protein